MKTHNFYNKRNFLFASAIAAAFALVEIENKTFNFFSKPQKESNTKTFLWGNGTYQAKPDSVMQFSNFEPKLMHDFLGKDKPNLKDVAIGEFMEAGISTTNEAYVWSKKELSSSKESEINDNIRENITKVSTQGSVKQMVFTKKFLWVLREDGKLLQYPLSIQYNKETDSYSASLNDKYRIITELTNLTQISAGQDHLAMLTSNGALYTMGDDTYGQCGVGDTNRPNFGPHLESRIGKPTLLQGLSKIKKVTCGSHHTLAITEDGDVYGWGSNSAMQLSHENEFSSSQNPLLAVFAPIKIERNLGNGNIIDVAAGEESSFFVTTNKINKETEVFACGKNLRGQLGIGVIRHVTDIEKIEQLSNYQIQDKGKDIDVRVEKLVCGLNHCMALLNIGVVMEWGDNEYGQLGNKKRVFTEKPIIVSEFVKSNILNINCGHTSSCVILKEDDIKK